MKRPGLVLAILLTALILTALACDPVGTTPATATDSQCTNTPVAVIEVFDGQLVRLSGCREAAGTVFPAGSPLTCTVSAKTRVEFHELGFTQHQIVAAGTPAIPSGPLFDPATSNPETVSAACLGSAGTYSFKDLFEPDLTGSLIAL